MTRAKSTPVGVYVIEEQEVYREAYRSALASRAFVDLLGISAREEISSIEHIIAAFKPDVLLVGVKRLRGDIIEELARLREGESQIGIVLLAMSYGVEDIDLLRESVLRGKGGIAVCSKQSLDEIEQLCRIIIGVSQGQIILDGLATAVFAEQPKCQFLKDLTARELEILGLLSRGYSNAAIAQALYIDIRTVKHHINSLYSKLKVESDLNGRHPRVSAARLYLRENGCSE